LSGIALILVRLAVILAGYACAALAASTALHVAWIGAAGFEPEQAPWLVVGSIAFSIPFVALFVAYFAFVPAAFTIGVAEFAGWRDWLTYALAGGFIAAVVASMFWRWGSADMRIDGAGLPLAGAGRPDDPQLLVALLAAGLVGGIVYWMVAGRGAGSWRRAPRARIPPLP
jgi:hypothetical protein